MFDVRIILVNVYATSNVRSEVNIDFNININFKWG